MLVGANPRAAGQDALHCPARLPPELIIAVAQQLHQEAHPELYRPLDAQDDGGDPYSPFLPPLTASTVPLNRSAQAKQTLLRLSSVSRDARTLLEPYIWSSVALKKPSDTVFLRSVAHYHDHRGAASARAAVRPCPLVYVSSINVCFPSDRFPNLQVDQATVLELFSRYAMSSAALSVLPSRTPQSQHLTGRKGRLRSFTWNADSLPHPAVWAHLATNGLQQLEIDCRTFWAGHPNWGRLAGLHALKLTSYDASLLPRFLPALLMALIEEAGVRDGVDERSTLKRTFRSSPDNLSQRLSAAALDEDHIDASGQLHRGEAGTLDQRTAADDASAGPTRQPDPQDFAEAYAQLDLTSRSSLLHLSLSSSKTSLMHSLPLIEAGVFSSLVTLDLYPVTPEYPLSLALASCGRSLRRLKLALDVNAALPNFDRLWRDLTGCLPELQAIDVDPFPNERSAPSFRGFLDSCPRLGWINGRRKEALPPGYELFDPDHRTGVFFY